MRIFGLFLLTAFAAQAALGQSATGGAPAAQSAQKPAQAKASSSTPAATDYQITRINVRDCGIFSADDQASSKPAVDGVSFTAVSKVHASKKTRTIPLRKGVNFGFQYELVGKPLGELATLHFVVIYPPPGVRKPGSSNPIPRLEYDQKARIGVKDSYDGYELDADWELLPGDWTLQIWNGSTQLASESFTLVKE